MTSLHQSPEVTGRALRLLAGDVADRDRVIHQLRSEVQGLREAVARDRRVIAHLHTQVGRLRSELRGRVEADEAAVEMAREGYHSLLHAREG